MLCCAVRVCVVVCVFMVEWEGLLHFLLLDVKPLKPMMNKTDILLSSPQTASLQIAAETESEGTTRG